MHYAYLGKRFIKPFLCIVLFFGSTCLAQTSKVQEIEQLLKQPHPDTARLHLLQQLAEAYSSVDPKKKFYYATIYKQLAEKLHDEHAVADAYINMGVAYGIQSRLDSAFYYFMLAYNKSVKSNYLLGTGRSLADMGFAYDRLDNKQESIKQYFKALAIFKKLNYERGINQCYINIGSIYHDLARYDVAITYYYQCLKSATKSNDKVGIAYARYTIGNCYQELGQDDKALVFLRQSLATRDSIGDINGSALVRRAMGMAYTHQKKYDQAISVLKASLVGMRSLHDKYQEVAILASLADVYLAMKDNSTAERYGLTAYSIAKDINSKIAESTALKVLMTVYRNKKQINKAFQYQSAYMASQDSIAAEKALKDVTLAEFTRIREENALLAKNNEVIKTQNTNNVARINNYSNVMVIVFVVLASVVLLLFIQYRRNIEKQAANRLLVQQKAEIASINQELAALNQELNLQMDLTHRQNIELGRLNDVKNKFFSIVSHDLRSPLSTLQTLLGIYHQGDIGEKELGTLLIKLEDTILTTGNFLDNLLEWSKSQFEGIVISPVELEVKECVDENIRLYETKIALKSLKVTNLISQPALMYADRNMISLVIRNLLSNSVKFCEPGDAITFTAETHDGRTVMAITDTGRGMSLADQEKVFNLDHTLTTGTQGEKGNHLGLILCRDMIMQNKGIIWFESNPGAGTTFWIDLPASNTQNVAGVAPANPGLNQRQGEVKG